MQLGLGSPSLVFVCFVTEAKKPLRENALTPFSSMQGTQRHSGLFVREGQKLIKP